MSDADPFETFVRRHQDMVYATAVRLLGRPADAEDVAQTTFLKAYEHFDQVGHNPAAPGWLKTVATNLCLNHLSRYRNRWRLFSEMLTISSEGAEEPFEWDLPGPPLGDALDESERQAALDEALRSLPAHQRVPLVLFHFDDMSYQEIADRLRVSLAKLKTDMHRGRLALKKHLSRGDT
jgi:RNA polymerase sigma-70 factor (ECF subfamily)